MFCINEKNLPGPAHHGAVLQSDEEQGGYCSWEKKLNLVNKWYSYV
jgi:hypothetical protein